MSEETNQAKGLGRGRKAIKVICIVLAALILITVGVTGFIYIKLQNMSRNAIGTVAKPTTLPLPVDTMPPVSLIPVLDKEDLDLTQDYDPEIDPVDIWNDPIYYESMIDPNVINILVLGRDALDEFDSGRTDTMMLLSYNKETRSAKLVSFLRDT